MNGDRLTSKAELEKLVRYFEQNIHQLKAPSFNEAQARQTLIDPFFEALGWDVRNRQMRPPHQWEVIPEGRVRTTVGKVPKEQTPLFDKSAAVREEMKEYASMLEYIADDEYKADQRLATKKPDYRFRLQGSTKFFVEAKKPFVDLMKNEDAIFQIKRYGFSARVPVSILTDFEEFRVFDCTRRPFYDKPKIGAIKEFDLGFKSYLDEFDKVYDTFSREAVIAGSIETVQKKYLEKKTGEFALDREFLEDLSDWRLELAKDIAKHPKNRRFLNEFTLKECVQRILDRIVFLRVCEDRGIEVSGTLLAILRLWQDHPALSLYDQFNKLIDQRRSLYNGLLFAQHECEQLVVGDKILETIFKNVNYPVSPYHFDGVGVEILGSIYERFLGQTIRLTPKQVRVEDKPEVRKAGGVYYTPQYIVNYIVDNTVGKLIEGKTPRQIEKIKIIDIACGSGSFLLGAFQKVIDHHVQYYTEHPTEIKEKHGVLDAYEDAQGRLVLSARKKREILVNNIYGVDIDQQAVEVTQMSLYLKVLENENDATLNKQTMLALHEVLLPPLKNNIKCGNSLIGTDFGSQAELFDDETRQKVNPFDWEIEFSEIIKNGGFDAVIGNPPYLKLTLNNMEPAIAEYYQEKYKSIHGGSSKNLFQLFIEKGLSLTRKGMSFIVPEAMLTTSSNGLLRKLMVEQMALHCLVVFDDFVFQDATIGSAVFVLSGSGKSKDVVVEKLYQNGTRTEVKRLEIGLPSENPWETESINEFTRILQKLLSTSRQMKDLVIMSKGMVVQDRSKHLRKKPKRGDLPFVLGNSIQRYRVVPSEFTSYDELTIIGGTKSLDRHLHTPRLLIRRTGDILCVAFSSEKELIESTVYILTSDKIDLKFLLGILNSRLLTLFLRQKLLTNIQGFPQVLMGQLEQLPIRSVELDNAPEKKMQHEIVALVDKMIELHKQLDKASFDSKKEPIERQIAATDKKIDALVYKLYGLTEEEIKIVEGKIESGKNA